MSDAYSATDEAFVMLTLENNIDDLKEMMNSNDNIEIDASTIRLPGRDKSNPRYTKNDTKDKPMYPKMHAHNKRRSIPPSGDSSIASARPSCHDIYQGLTSEGVNRFNMLCTAVRKNRGLQKGKQADLRNFQKYKRMCGLFNTDNESDINDSEDDKDVYVYGFDEFTEVANDV